MKAIKIIVLIFSPVLFFKIGYSQNNYKDNPMVYYNLKDTINNCDRGTMKVQLYDIIDEEILDSLSQYIKEIKGFGECDSDGVFIYFDIGFGLDSDYITGVFVTSTNYRMFWTLGGDEFQKINRWSPDYYKSFLLGCTIYDDYLVAIVTNRYVSEIELSHLFFRREEKIVLRMYESQTFKTEIKYYRMTKPIKKELVDKRNYVSPVIPLQYR